MFTIAIHYPTIAEVGIYLNQTGWQAWEAFCAAASKNRIVSVRMAGYENMNREARFNPKTGPWAKGI